MEHNGDVYSCDHYMYPDYRIGNIYQDPFAEMMDSEQQRQSENIESLCRNIVKHVK